MHRAKRTWPGGRRFAFAIVDDTDLSTLVNTRPVYDVLIDHGVRPTKTVWPFDPAGPPTTGGESCEDPAYRAWVLGLQQRGVEIGYHNAADHPSERAITIAALDRFRDLFGHDPRVGADHVGNREAVYWGRHRLSGWRGAAYAAATRLSRPERGTFHGHDPASPWFWGDVLRDRIDYWRSFTYSATDTLAACPRMPYHDPARPYVNWWFAATHAPTLEPFLSLLAPDRLDRLEATGGVCLAYTHLGAGFAPDGVLDPRLPDALGGLADRDPWLPTVSELLDHLRTTRTDDAPLAAADRRRMEQGWMLDHLRLRGVDEARRAVRRLRR